MRTHTLVAQACLARGLRVYNSDHPTRNLCASVHMFKLCHDRIGTGVPCASCGLEQMYSEYVRLIQKPVETPKTANTRHADRVCPVPPKRRGSLLTVPSESVNIGGHRL